ncbi:MAG: hypothetical protein MUC49_14755 [Raineya sp.]|jgi:lysozyme family protein|nr:hypothetical protein [Raineya sp.]
MADINPYFDKMIEFEGGYALVAGDYGGHTKYGVTLATWKQFGFDKNGDMVINELDVKALTLEDAKYILNKVFWSPMGANEIKTQLLAEIMVDWGYNSGAGYASKRVQNILNTQFGANLVEDGRIGKATIQAINKADQAKLYSIIWATRKQFYYNIVAYDATQKKFLQGWLNRLNKFPSELPAEALKKK